MTSDDQWVIVSYLTLRRILGMLGLVLPVLLAAGCFAVGNCTGLEDSISDYYGTDMRDVLVGTLFAIGWFLFAYRGYEPIDNIAGNVACFCSLGVALFPVTSPYTLVRSVHFLSAAVLFIVLACFALFLFTKTARHSLPTPEKKVRNKVYVACGVSILACIALIAVYRSFPQGSSIVSWRPVFWLESLALWAFGIAWFVKGETLFKDQEARG